MLVIIVTLNSHGETALKNKGDLHCVYFIIIFAFPKCIKHRTMAGWPDGGGTCS